MRAFLAVVPPPDAVAVYVAALPSWRSRWPDLGWVAPERWHVTLAFLGDVSDGQVDRLRLDLGAAPPVSLAVSGGGCFPAADKARVVWAGLAGDVDGLAVLARAARAAAAEVGVPKDPKPFRAHLTLARVRRPPAVLTDLVADLDGLAGPAWPAREVVLFRSRLGPNPAYEPRRTWPL